MIKSTEHNQHTIIKDIISLHTPEGIEVDVTYSKGVFYRDVNINEPRLKFDLFPQTPDTVKASADKLPLLDSSVSSLMFDPPFIVGFKEGKQTGIMGNRFGGFKNIKALWEFYDNALTEFYRVLKPNGVLIVKTQDTVSSGKNWFSHIHLANKAEELGFYHKDLFVLLAKHRIKGHNHTNQKHARKFHSYFMVLIKKEKK